ncbi:MAG TPA: hypothetical protein VHA70_13710 [Bauldia sp.]|nr:hypothetical protein [Bauldia sp.]
MSAGCGNAAAFLAPIELWRTLFLRPNEYQTAIYNSGVIRRFHGANGRLFASEAHFATRPARHAWRQETAAQIGEVSLSRGDSNIHHGDGSAAHVE